MVFGDKMQNMHNIKKQMLDDNGLLMQTFLLNSWFLLNHNKRSSNSRPLSICVIPNAREALVKKGLVCGIGSAK